MSSGVDPNQWVSDALKKPQVQCSSLLENNETALWTQRFQMRYIETDLVVTSHTAVDIHSAILQPKIDLEKAKDLKAKIRSIERNNDNYHHRYLHLGERLPVISAAQDKILQVKFQLTSDFLNSIGVRHLTFRVGKRQIVSLILPGKTHVFNREAEELYRNHGTLLTVDWSGQPFYHSQKNTLALSISQALTEQIGERTEALKQRIKSQRVSEIDIVLGQSKQEEIEFLLAADNAILESLRFASFSLPPGSILDQRFRFSFRTGLVANLKPEIRKSIELAVKSRNGHGAAFLALRDVHDKWTSSFPVYFPKNSALNIGPAYDEIKHKIGVKKEAEEIGLSDLFLVLAKDSHFAPPDIVYLNTLATGDTTSGLNSISIVNVVNSAQGLVYYIHTHKWGTDFDSQRDMTLLADQLAQPLDLEAAREIGRQTGVPYDPFRIGIDRYQ